MTNNLPNPLQQTQTQKPAIYRPRYRARAANPSYALEGASQVQETGFETLVDALEELDAWQAAEREESSEHQTVRWHPSRCQSLRVYLHPATSAQAVALFWRAVRQWEAAAFGQLRLEATSRPDQADIKLLWSDSPVYGREFEVGHTDRALKPPHWIQLVTITLVTHPAIDQQLSAKQQADRLYVTFLHELGHALGLEHSTDKRSVMYHQGWLNTQLSRQDTDALRRLYADAQPTSFTF